jgi:hypothetical protein
MLDGANIPDVCPQRPARPVALCTDAHDEDDPMVRVVPYGEVWEVRVAGVVVSWASDRTTAEREATIHARPIPGRH